MRPLHALEPAAAWGTTVLGAGLRSLAFWRSALIAATLVVAGRGFDLLSFAPDPHRASLVGVQTGALVGAIWAVLCPTTLVGVREGDDGWTATLRSSAAGSPGLWWGAWGAQICLGWGLLALSLLSTSVFSIFVGLTPVVQAAAMATAAVSVLVAGLVASAGAAWGGPIVGALLGIGAWGAGQVGGGWAARALGPLVVGGPLPAAELLRTAALAVAAIAVATAGLRRLRL